MLRVYRAERADTLADELATQLATPLADPMQTEIVAVAARGVERWLQQHLATRLGVGAPGASDGIAANIDFSSSAEVVAKVMASLSQDPDAAQNWRADRLVWPVLQVLDEHLDDPRLAVIAHFVGQDGADGAGLRRGRRISAARTIADLLDSYAWQRPTMLRDWAAGRDTDGAGSALPPSLSWQPWFWRVVRQRVGLPHVADELPDICARVRAEPAIVDLPARLSLFGPTRLPQTLRELLAALAAHRQVGIYLPHPSDALWQAVASHANELRRAGTSASMHRAAQSPAGVTNPLLAALSRDVQELQLCLADSAAESIYCAPTQPRPVATLLSHLQAGFRTDTLAPVPGAVADTSVEIHACHGPERQVEVMRDRLLHLFADDPTLAPRDVVVMCPDVEAYAPLIRGAFGQGDLRAGPAHPAFGLRVRLADRGLRQTNAVLDAAAEMLELAAGRVTVGQLLDFAAREPVARRFAFSPDDLEVLSGWAERAHIRWGVDGTQRSRFGMGRFAQGTAGAGVDRLILGVLADESEGQWLSTALPLAGIDSTDTDLVGRFAEYVGRLGEVLRRFGTPHSSDEWAEHLRRAIDLLTDTDHETEWQRGQAVGVVADAFEIPSGTTPAKLELSDVRELMSGILAARPTRSNFRTGELTVCSMVPMRAVPHRAIVLLGMDDGVFPRSTGVDGDDVLGVVPLIGERDVRTEDRQVFADAITAASDHLLVFYSGADPVSGSERPPAVVVSELIDAAHIVLGVPTGTAASPVVRRHTLHAFDAANFRAGSSGTSAEPLSFDSALLPGAAELATLSATGSAPRRPRLCDARLPAAQSDDIDLDELKRHLRASVEGFLRQRLRLALPEDAEGERDQLDVKLEPLDAWPIGDRLLSSLLRGDDPLAAQRAELRRGSLPPFALGTDSLRPVAENAAAVHRAAMQYRTGVVDAVDVRVRLGDGRRLYGTVGGVFAGAGGRRLTTVTYSKLAPKQRLAAWIELLAVRAGAAVAVAEAVVVGRGGQQGLGGAAISRLQAPDDAQEALELLVAVRDAGLRRPLPMPLSAAEACAREFSRSGNAGAALRRAEWAFAKSFESGDSYAGLAFHDNPAAGVDFDTLVGAWPSSITELAELNAHAARLPGDDTTPAFVRIATAVFAPLLENEAPQ